MRDEHGVTTTVTLEAVSVILCAEVSRAYLASILQDYNDYCLQQSGRGEAERVRASSGVHFDALLEKDLLWIEANDAEGVTEEALFATRSMVSAVEFEIPVPRKGYMEILRSFV